MISLATFCKRKASRCTLPGTLEIRILYNNENEKKRMENNKKKKELKKMSIHKKYFLFLFFFESELSVLECCQ